MKKYILIILAGFVFFAGCKKSSLEVTNLNQPTAEILTNEGAILSYAKGFYNIGFNDVKINSLDDGLGYGMMWIVNAFHESMGDNIFIPWGNNSFKFADNPTSVKLDNGTVVPNPIGQGNPFELKLRNDRAFGASNSFLPEWTYMYFLNNSTNVLLSKIDEISYSGDAATKKNVLKAWAKWWKGYAYCRIGSMYIAGLIIDAPNGTNGTFVTNTKMIEEGLKNLDEAAAILSATSGEAYNEVMERIMTTYLRGAKGVPTAAEWVRNINTLKARSILINKKVADMTAGDWTNIKSLVDEGIQSDDYAFVIKTFADNSLSIIRTDNTFETDISGNIVFRGGGPLQSEVAGENNTGFISERLIQDFKDGDKRRSNNFDLLSSAVIYKRGRSITFGTRYKLLTGGKGNGAYTYFNGDPGQDLLYIGGSYEENELMKAECLIQTGQINQGLVVIDAVRSFQNAELPASGIGLNKQQALEELRKERRCALAFRGLAFYDYRRNGITEDVSKGGGRTACVVLDQAGVPNTNALINYNYLPYWDVPQNELDFNPPAAGSAKVKYE